MFINCGSSHVVHFLAAHPTVLARDDEAYRELLNEGDLNVPDGIPVAWALRLFGCPAERLAGSDAMSSICQWGLERGTAALSVREARPRSWLASRPTSRRASPASVSSAPSRRRFGHSTDDEWFEAGKRINTSGADLVWVGLGAPKQDWAAERLRELDSAPAILCVGAAFDFLSGTKRRAPRLIQRLGLEWLHRLASDPRRLWRRYLVGNLEFLTGVLRDYGRGARLGTNEFRG